MSTQQGYMSDIDYISEFYRELAPAVLDYVCVSKGLYPPRKSADSAFRYCELGCGQGVSLNVLASCYPQGEFHGIDFMPSHVVSGQKFASDGNLNNVFFYDCFFEEALGLNFEKFDYIVLHGTFSWVSKKNQAFIIEFINQYLKAGGIVYNSYNCLPGDTTKLPLQHLLRQYGEITAGNSVSKINSAIDFVHQLKSFGTSVFNEDKKLAKLIDLLPEQNKNYLVHEYMHEHWQPLYFDQVFKPFQEIRLNYVGSARLLDNVDAYRFSPEMQQTILALPTVELQELTRDMLCNQQFRGDVYVKGACQIPLHLRESSLLDIPVALTCPEVNIKYKWDFPIGEIGFDTPATRFLCEQLQYNPQTLQQILVTQYEFDAQTLLESLQVLLMTDQAVVLDRFEPVKNNHVYEVNQVIFKRILTESPLMVVVSPLGNGFLANYMLLLIIGLADQYQGQDLVDILYEEFKSAGRDIIANTGEVLKEEMDAKQYIQGMVELFEHNFKAWYGGLGILNANG
jgi:SAM-dependent methyltransferase